MSNNNNLYVPNANDYEVDPILDRNNPSRRPITGPENNQRPGIAGKIRNMFHRNDRNDYNDYDYNRGGSYYGGDRNYDFNSDDKTRYDWERSNKGNDLIYNPRSNFKQDYWDSRDYRNESHPMNRSMFDKNADYRNNTFWYDDNWNARNRPFTSDKVGRDNTYDNYDDYDRKPSLTQKIKNRVGSSGYQGNYTDRRDRYVGNEYGPAYGPSGRSKLSRRRGSRSSSSSSDNDDDNNNRRGPSFMDKIKRNIPGSRSGMGGNYNDWNNRSYYDRNNGMGGNYNDWNNRNYDNYWGSSMGYMPTYHSMGRFDQNYNFPMMGTNIHQQGARWYPNIDICEDMSKNMYCLCVELPGVNKSDVHVDIDNERLIIWGEKICSTAPQLSSQQSSTTTSSSGVPPPLPTGFSGSSNINSQVHKAECPYGKFYRTVILPKGVDSSQVQAWLENGVLYVNIPKPVQTLRPGINIADSRPVLSTDIKQQQQQQSQMVQQPKTYQQQQPVQDNAFSLTGKQTKLI